MAFGPSKRLKWRSTIILGSYPNQNGPTNFAEEPKNHYDKAALATELHTQNILSKGLGDEILRLNNLRKDVHYGEPGFELGEEDLESLVSDLEGIVNEVESMISRMEQAADDE